MPSPFPGMDPYLERHWGDIHQALIAYARDAIRDQLPGDLRARLGERIYVEAPEDVKQYYPDIRVVEHPRPRRDDAPEPAGRAIAEPIIIEMIVEPIHEGYIEIIDASSGGRVVTSIEVLSPANKNSGRGRRLFRDKQRRLRAGRVNTVEIDLLRAGRRVLAVPQRRIRPDWRTPYQVCVWRAKRPENAELYRIPLRERLPVIPVPLRRKDKDAALDLQALLDRCYEYGDYADIDYRAEPDPPLDPDDAAWADTLLRERGLR
jgi:hypothetical protein